MPSLFQSTHTARVLGDTAHGEVLGLPAAQLAGLAGIPQRRWKEGEVEAVESQVLEAASEGPTPGLGSSRAEPPTHVHLRPQALQLVRPEAQCHQVAEPVIPAPGKHQSRTAQHLSPDLALAQEHRQAGGGVVGELEQQASRLPRAEEEGHSEVGARQLVE